MNQADLLSLLPELILCAGGVVILLLDAIAPALRKAWTPLAVLTTLAAGWAEWSAQLAPGEDKLFCNGLLETNNILIGLALIVLITTGLCLLASQAYLVRERILAGEYHALLLWCATGLILMVRSTELLTVFVALELFSLALYTLAGYHRRLAVSVEAAIKYFLMGAFVSAFVLYGVALVYGGTGSTRFAEIAAAYHAGHVPLSASLGMLLIIAGFGFKLSLVPFHAWSPDTYQGAPSPFVAFLSVAPKVASVYVIYRLLASVAPYATGVRWGSLIAILSALSMVTGNLLALVQRDLKRMLAYSGIAHMGYLLLALVSVDGEAQSAILLYLLAYALMNAGAFAVVALLYSHPGDQHLISDLSGWGYRFPLLGGCLTVCMLSLAGIPPTLGFFGKYLVFLTAIDHYHTHLATLGVLTSLVGVFYYLRVVYTLYMKSEIREPQGLLIDNWGRAAAVLSALGTLVLGIWPSRILEWLVATTGMR
jgi:NADH-quinone oxidoreductase subunit N